MELPKEMTYSFSTSISKKEARKLHLLVNPLTRPAHISPKKKVSWRLTKKWFNRYEKTYPNRPHYYGRVEGRKDANNDTHY